MKIIKNKDINDKLVISIITALMLSSLITEKYLWNDNVGFFIVTVLRISILLSAYKIMISALKILSGENHVGRKKS